MSEAPIVDGLRTWREGALGRLRLARPLALNALDHALVRALQRGLDADLADDDVRAILLDAEPGRAFSAGGDVRALFEGDEATGLARRRAFIRDEYRLDLAIARSPKPVVAAIDGIAMGGGVGVSINAALPLACDAFSFAMPEV
ncbi:MAG: enoyl-CoA hydratase/isomerase family protein, partial [Hyphomicrobiales bacterium]|nr:enoyl-CoA hydratase/isomerase family protein [Hyphomicrobiales bacterium]